MKFKWDTLWLTDNSTHARDVTFNGRQIVQEAAFLRASLGSVFARKNRMVQIGFSAQPRFGTVKTAEEFLLNHYNTLADAGTLTARIGLESETPYEVLLQNAVLEDVSAPRYIGASVEIRYQFRAPAVSGIVYAPPANEDMRTGTVSIPQDAESLVVAGLGLPAIPLRVLATVSRPLVGIHVIVPTVDYSTITAAGFTVYFSSQPENPDYKLNYLLVL
jgi:hypothetical protein